MQNHCLYHPQKSLTRNGVPYYHHHQRKIRIIGAKFPLHGKTRGKRLGIQHRTIVPPALSQHIHVELTLAEVTAVVVQALQENKSQKTISSKFIFPLQPGITNI